MASLAALPDRGCCSCEESRGRGDAGQAMFHVKHHDPPWTLTDGASEPRRCWLDQHAVSVPSTSALRSIERLDSSRAVDAFRSMPHHGLPSRPQRQRTLALEMITAFGLQSRSLRPHFWSPQPVSPTSRRVGASTTTNRMFHVKHHVRKQKRTGPVGPARRRDLDTTRIRHRGRARSGPPAGRLSLARTIGPDLPEFARVSS